jgi:hypothetical protein
MSSLSIDLFVSARDAEAAEYRVLAGLLEARRAFTRSRVYPHLAELITLRRTLAGLVDGADRVDAGAPNRVVGVDWEAGAVVHERQDVVGAPLAIDLARWTLPRLDLVIEEGRTLFEFVDAHAALASVGLLPAYQAEGFLLLPETGGGWRALRYAVSSLAGDDGAYRALRTVPVPVSLPMLAPPAAWKRALADACAELPAPATFLVETDVAFPLEETVLPVAKRKLLRLVAAGEA